MIFKRLFRLMFKTSRFQMIDEKLTNEFLKIVEENKKLIYKVSYLYCDSTIDRKDLFSGDYYKSMDRLSKFSGEFKSQLLDLSGFN